MEHALQDNANQLFVAKYQLYLPKREELQAQLDRLLEIKLHFQWIVTLQQLEKPRIAYAYSSSWSG